MKSTKKGTRRSFEQLRSATWPSEAAAVADLRASGVPRGAADYELRQSKPGIWLLAPRDGDAPGDREQRVIDSLRRKKGAPRKGEPVVVAEAKAPAKAKRSALVPHKPVPKPEAAPKTLFGDILPPAPESPPEPTPPPAPGLLSPLPVDAGPYQIVLRSTDGTFPDNSVVPWAVTVSRRMKCVVHIINGAGEEVRAFDITAIRAASRGAGRGRPNKAGGPKSSGKSAAAATLLARPEGATFAEVQQITEWGITERFVRRLGRARKMDAVQLGDRHWKLVPIDE